MSRPLEAPESPYAHLKPLELVRNNIETERLEVIPLARILTETALIDDSHATELAQSMKGKRGQISPIAVRVREDEERELVYDVLDGYHRTEGKKRDASKTGDFFIKANVLYGCSDEEMYDLRILAASSVRSVQFPRIAQWITKSFATTAWAESGLTVTQAFGIAVNDSERSNTAKTLSPDELDKLKEWVQLKTERWGKSVSSTYQILRTVEVSDPALVQQVRHSGGGHDNAETITPTRLKVVVNRFPGVEYFPAQNAILSYATDRKLGMPALQDLLIRAETIILPGMGEAQIRAELDRLTIKPGKSTQYVEDENDSESIFDEEPTPFELQNIARGKEVVVVRPSIDVQPKQNPHAKKINGKSPHIQTNGGRVSDEDLARGEDSIPALRARIADLEKALKNATNHTGSSDLWWQTAIYLTPPERNLMEYVMDKNIDLHDLSIRSGVPEAQLIGMIKSAYAKRRNSEQLGRMKELFKKSS